MDDKITLIQPKYVKNFKCDGQRCDAMCCKDWRIEIDAATFEKYKQAESAEKEITSKLKYDEARKSYVVQLNDKNFCPFLTEENLCSIQKKYGENFLSFTCKNFPRRIVNVGNVLEYSLNLSCPLVAELALTSYEAMSIEVYKIPRKKNLSPTNKIPEKIQPYFHFIQAASMFILKIADWTMDQRLAVIGFLWKDADELIKENKFNDIEKIAKSYTSLNFLEEKGAKIFSETDFDHKKFLTIMFDGVFKNLYSPIDKDYIIIKNFFMPTIDDGENISMDAAKMNFAVWLHKKEIFLKKVDMIFSNYIAHEIFYNLYPYRLQGSVAKNFATLVAAYKLVELLTFIINFNKTDLRNVINCISKISRKVDNSNDFMKKIFAAVEGEEDIPKIISTFLLT